MLCPRSLRTIITKRLPTFSTPYSSSSCNTGPTKPILRTEDAPRSSSKPTRGAKPRKSFGTLAMRRALLSNPRKRQQSNSTSSSSSSSSVVGGGGEFLSLDGGEGNTFKPVHLYPGQIALHTSFTPPHMPLPVHLGTLRYKSPRYNTDANVDNLFSPQPQPNPVPFLRQLQGTNAFPTSILTEHTGIRIMFNNPTHIGHLLPEHTGTTNRGSSYNRLRHDNSSDLGVEVDFNRLMAHNASIASQSWNQVLSAMNAATTSTTTSQESNSKIDVDSAVVELSTLLERMEMEEMKDDLRRRSGGRRGQVTFHRRGKMIRMSTRREVEEVDDDEVTLDSVKRKRKKKISKHKYKKRRKATRSERKKLGK